MAGSGRAEVPFERFQEWADRHNDGKRVLLTEMAELSGRTSNAYSSSRARGSVDVRNVIAYARGVGASPRHALSVCLDLPDLGVPTTPTAAEWLSQVPYVSILEEAESRLGGRTRGEVAEGRTSVARWLEVLTPAAGGSLKALAAAAGMDYPGFRARRARETFAVKELHTLAGVGGGSTHLALVAQGLLTWEEAGLDPEKRGAVLAAESDSDLFGRIASMARDMRRAATH